MQVQRREKFSRILLHTLRDLVHARILDPEGGVRALQEQGEDLDALADAPEPSGAALEAVEAFWEQYTRDRDVERQMQLQQEQMQRLQQQQAQQAGGSAPGTGECYHATHGVCKYTGLMMK